MEKNKRTLTIKPRWIYSIAFWPGMSLWTQVVRLLAVYALTVALVLYAWEGLTFAQRRRGLIARYGKSIQIDWLQVRMCCVHPMLLWQILVIPWHTFPNIGFKGASLFNIWQKLFLEFIFRVASAESPSSDLKPNSFLSADHHFGKCSSVASTFPIVNLENNVHKS